MGRLHDFLRWLFPRQPARSEAEADQLRVEFKTRYHSFRRLLEANNRSLEIMAEIEQTLGAGRPFGMTYVRARCTRAATHVWRMIRHLDELAPGRYAALRDRFRAIQQQIDPHCVPRRRSADGRLVLSLGEISFASAEEVGNKMANLGELRNNAGLEVPDGFVVTARGFRMFMEHEDLQGEIIRRLQALGGEHTEPLPRLSSRLQQLIIDAPLPKELEQAIVAQYGVLEKAHGEDVAVAVRSSAMDEDVVGASIAGQYRSELNVRADGLLEAYKMVVASTYGLAAISFRMGRGLRHDAVTMCVGVLPMVDALAGGVLYSRNPVDQRDDSITINSAWGLPKPVVEGQIPCDLFVVAREDPPRVARSEIPEKPSKFVSRAGEGVQRRDTTAEERGAPSLTEDQVLELARVAIRLEAHHGSPRDVEWAIDRRGRVTLLQSRELRRQERSEPVAAPGSADSLGEVLASGGVTASSGAAYGPVFHVEKEADTLRFPAGAVLVTSQPLPRWASLLNRAVAVVAEHGSVAGHLASVARELDVPSLFGVEAVVSRLPQRTTVTVDADGRAVYRGRIGPLLVARPKRANPMEGTPVHETLRAAAEQIIPLHLLDPDAPEFRAENCNTLHDITRFCHEMAVQQMFRFGKDHHFPERSSKQLYHDVPMQWWVLNLDDGFKEELTGRYVKLEQISCAPMLALWEGITAIPWEGPPPLDGKGFMSVMFRATTNTALNPSARSRYADRNYFMVSKDYCSLSSRLGAHFAIIEALVSERALENYVSFQFKGGAADFDRRLKRVVLLKQILEDYSFRVELHEDNLIARLESREMEFTKSRLRILGYLTMHTRQLDMVMARPASVSHYLSKFRRDIRRVLAVD